MPLLIRQMSLPITSSFRGTIGPEQRLIKGIRGHMELEKELSEAEGMVIHMQVMKLKAPYVYLQSPFTHNQVMLCVKVFDSIWGCGGASCSI